MSEKITFKELVELIAKQSKQSESSANSFIHELVQIIESGLKQTGTVSISGFGKFELRWMKERAGVNPQTGDEITIPGQNKVVFKPFKALRETVNKPFASLRTEILSETPESINADKNADESEETEASDDPFGLEDVFESEDPFNTADSYDFQSSIDDESDDPMDEPIPSINDLIIERENPRFVKHQTETAEDEGGVLLLEDEEEIINWEPKVAPILPDETKMAEEVQKSGAFKWSYAAAVIIVMIALIILFFMMQRSGENLEEAASTGSQTEQLIEPSTSDEAAETEEESAAGEPQPAIDAEPAPENSGSPPQNELETEPYTVQGGQSLWDIAESELGNPYLWPAIYHLNENIIDNPNQLLANADIQIPAFSNPDNLSEAEREHVALGYFSLYQWNRENNPDEARYFLWAVGVFSQDLLDQPPSQVDTQDLAFARNR